MKCRSPSRHKAVLLHLAPQRDGADFERLSRLFTIPSKPLEGAFDRGALLCLEIEAAVVRSTLPGLL